jgi:hypothetical protein
MDDPILTPRGAGGYLTATDVADLKLGITDGDARLFIDGAGAREHTLQPRRVLDRARRDLYGVVSLQRRGNANPLNHSNRGELPQEATMQDESTFLGNPPDVRAPSFWRTGVALVLALLAALLIASRAEADSRIKTNGCKVYDVNRFDPIAHASHLHEQIGNTSLDNDSTGESLFNHKENSCKSESSWFTSAGWYPTPQKFDAEHVAVYYRDPGDIDVKPIPTGLKLLTHEALFNGRSTTVHFPNCLAVQNGKPVLDSSDHESHARDMRSKPCPSSHPYRIPRISYLIQWNGSLGASTPISMGVDQWAPAGDDMHADYFGANQPVFNDRLIDLCLNDVPNNVDVAHPDCGKEGG